MGHVYEMARGRRTRQEHPVFTGPMEDYRLGGLRIAVWARAIAALELSPVSGDRDAAAEMRTHLSMLKHPASQAPRGGA